MWRKKRQQILPESNKTSEETVVSYIGVFYGRLHESLQTFASAIMLIDSPKIPFHKVVPIISQNVETEEKPLVNNAYDLQISTEVQNDGEPAYVAHSSSNESTDENTSDNTDNLLEDVPPPVTIESNNPTSMFCGTKINEIRTPDTTKRKSLRKPLENLSELSFSQHFSQVIAPKDHIYTMRYLIDWLYTCILDVVQYVPFGSFTDRFIYENKILGGFLKMRKDVHEFADIPLLNAAQLVETRIASKKVNLYLDTYNAYFQALKKYILNINTEFINGQLSNETPISFLVLHMQVFFLRRNIEIKPYASMFIEISDEGTSKIKKRLEKMKIVRQNFSKCLTTCEQLFSDHQRKHSLFNNTIGQTDVNSLLTQIMQTVAEVEYFFSQLDFPGKLKDWEIKHFTEYLPQSANNLRKAILQWTPSIFIDSIEERNNILILFFLEATTTQQDFFRIAAYTGYMQRRGKSLGRQPLCNFDLFSILDTVDDEPLQNDSRHNSFFRDLSSSDLQNSPLFTRNSS